MVILYVVYIIYFNIFYVFICCGGRSCAFTGQVSWKQPSESLCLPAVYSGNEFEGKLEGAAALLTQHVTSLWRAKAKLVKNKPPQPNKSKKKNPVLIRSFEKGPPGCRGGSGATHGWLLHVRKVYQSQDHSA